MKKYWMIALCLVGLMVAAGHAKAQEAESQTYEAGYEAGADDRSPPDDTSSDEYRAGWNAGHAAASGAGETDGQ